MGKSTSIFNTLGYAGISTMPAKDLKELVKITLADDKKANVVLATAPILGLSVEERADCSITKALNGDFVIASFGDTPVKLTISGVSILYTICQDRDNKATKGSSVASFFKSNKISTDATKRIKVAIASSPTDTTTYTCALIGYDTSFNEEYNEYNASRYTLHLIGVADK
jgi:hypothetical protein